MKSGWRTSEFWLAFVVSLVPMLPYFGVMDSTDVTPVTNEANAIIGHIVSAIVSAAYIFSRMKLKK